MKLIISAMPKNGSTVILFILQDLFKAKRLFSQIIPLYNPILKEISNVIPYQISLEDFSAIYNNGMEVRLDIIKKQQKFNKKAYFFINNNLLHDLLKDKKNLIIRINESCDKIMTNPFFEDYKKIFIIRNVFDIIHSSFKFIDESLETYQLYKKNRNQDLLTLDRYKKIGTFLDYIFKWKYHVHSYFNNRKNFHLLKFEDFINNPLTSLKRIDFISKNFTDKMILQSIDKYINKELLKNKSNHHKFFKHYNKGKKIGDFNRFFSDEMIALVLHFTKEELEKLGYNIDKLIDNNIKKYEPAKELKTIYGKILSHIFYFNSVNLSNKPSIAIVGAAHAAKIAYEDLKNIFKILCFIDDFKNGKYYSLPIVSREKFKEKFLDKTEFIVKGPYQRGFDIDFLYKKKIINFEVLKLLQQKSLIKINFN